MASVDGNKQVGPSARCTEGSLLKKKDPCVCTLEDLHFIPDPSTRYSGTAEALVTLKEGLRFPYALRTTYTVKERGVTFSTNRNDGEQWSVGMGWVETL